MEKVNHTAAQRWWRTLADELTVEQAQADCDRFATVRGDTRLRRSTPATGKATVATVAAREPLRPVPPTPYPLLLTETRVVSRQALVSYRGNQYSVPPELASATVTVTQPSVLGYLDIATTTGIVVARHRLAADGAGVQVRDHGHVAALEPPRWPPPPRPAGRTAARNGSHPASRPSRRRDPRGDHHASTTASTVIDLAAYERAAHGRNTLS